MTEWIVRDVSISGMSKRIRVSDPEKWYGKGEIEVSMWHNKSFTCKDSVRIMFQSIDDFAMYRDFDEADLDTNWSRCCEIFYNLPEKISVQWLLDHGFEFYR